MSFRISSSRQEAFAYEGLEVQVDWRVPTAVEVEQFFGGKKENSELFRTFVIQAASADVDGWLEGVGPDVVLATPGMYTLVSDVAKAIVDSCFLTPVQKN